MQYQISWHEARLRECYGFSICYIFKTCWEKPTEKVCFSRQCRVMLDIGLCLLWKISEPDQTLYIHCMISHDLHLHSSSAVLPFAISQNLEAEHQGTITSLLLLSSAISFRFEATLQYLDIDTAKFVCDKIQQGPPSPLTGPPKVFALQFGSYT